MTACYTGQYNSGSCINMSFGDMSMLAHKAQAFVIVVLSKRLTVLQI